MSGEGKLLNYTVAAPTPELKAKFLRLIEEATAEHIKAGGCRAVCLFGGGAKRGFCEGSDIDLAVFSNAPEQAGESLSLIEDVYIHSYVAGPDSLKREFEAACALSGGSDPLRLLFDFKPVYDPDRIFRDPAARLRRKLMQGGALRPEALARVMEIELNKAEGFLKEAARTLEAGDPAAAEENGRWALYFLAVAIFALNGRRNGGVRFFLSELRELQWTPRGFADRFVALQAMEASPRGGRASLREIEALAADFCRAARIDPKLNQAAEICAILRWLAGAGWWEAFGFARSRLPLAASHLWEEKSKKAGRLSPGPWLVNYKGLELVPGVGPRLADGMKKIMKTKRLSAKAVAAHLEEIGGFFKAVRRETRRRFEK